MNTLLALGDLIWTYPSYPELMLAKGWTRPDANLAKFDEIAAQRHISLFAGTDAHSNIGFHVFGDDAGNKPLGIKLDPYETVFRMARLHVLIEKDKEFDRETLIDAIRAGRYFVGFDVLGDTAGFRFTISSPTDSWSGGDVVENRDGLLLNASSPTAAISRFVIYRNGQSIHDSKEEYWHSTEIPVPGPGVYRVEGYRDWLGQPFDKMPTPLKTNPRIGLYKGSAPSMDEGWTRLVFDNFQIPFKSISDADFRSNNLNFDAIILPADSENTIVKGLNAERYGTTGI